MKKDKITVYLNDQPVQIYRGMKVKNALCAQGMQALNLAVLSVVDAEGHELGMEGELTEEMRLYTIKKENDEK